ncbi:MAG TPA: ATP-binding protein [Dehalococcoidia bacterium]|nr:ATP-binding protein [Dehalococcoidia bacterium]HIN25523.1 ATP-binding protein [Dehalococcoidia bacterium]
MTNRQENNGAGQGQSHPEQGQPLGMVIEGSVANGVEVRLDPGVSVEQVKVGTFVTLQGANNRFFGVVTDVGLGSTDPRLKYTPLPADDPFVIQALQGTVAFGTISVLPQLTLPDVLGDEQGPAAAKSIPSHFSRAFTASQEDVETVFGSEEDGNFWIGSPLDMETKLCLDLGELVKRSMGVFGKSGTGKTFLTRLLLTGIVQSGQASSLIFDMHSEYGWQGQDTDKGRMVKGLKQLFGSKVSTFTLDEEHSRRRGLSTDETVHLGFNHIEPEDVELLRESLNLSEVAASATYNLREKFGEESWLKEFLDVGRSGSLLELADELQVNAGALRALYNRMGRFTRHGFMVEHSRVDTAAQMVEHLERGQHVVLEFGRYGDDEAAYILVSNLLTRRIHRKYVEAKESAMGGVGKEPRPLVIVIEEAHKFLNSNVASQTIFGIIARELRKYNVTLMVIDQRPSGIDPEVLSQVGTRFCCLLDNERDIDAVLSGTSGSRALRSVLSRLEAKQQALVFGHALPLPVVVRIRDYGPAFYETIKGGGDSEEERQRKVDELFGE